MVIPSTTTIPTPTASATPGESSSLPIDSFTELDSASRAVLAGWRKGGNSGASAADAATEQPTSKLETEADDSTDENEDNNAADNTGTEGNDDGEGQTDTTEEEAETDAETETEETEEESEEEEEETETEDGKKTNVQKRFDKLTAQKAAIREERDTAREEAAALKTELETLRGKVTTQPIPLVPLPEDPLSTLTTETDVDARIQKAEATIAWCKANRRGASVPRAEGSTEMVDLDEDEISDLREREEEILSKHAPARKEYIQTFAKATDVARKSYPTIFQTGHDDQKYAQAVMKTIPGLARHPLHELFIGDMLLGASIRHGKAVVVRKEGKDAPGKPAVVLKKTPVKTPLSSSAVSPTAKPAGSKPDTSALKAKAFESGSQADVDKLFEAKFG